MQGEGREDQEVEQPVEGLVQEEQRLIERHRVDE